MYKVTEEYKQYIENKTSLIPKCKIVVDGVEYTGKIIKTVPKISHKAEKMIGSFPIRTCSFDIYDLDNSLNFENKEIYVFKGLLINNEVEYIPQGIFIAESDKITTDITKRTISFNNIQDRTIKFDALYKTKLDWSINHTGLEIIEEICEELGIPLETKDFNWYDYEFKQPNFLENCTYREVVSRMAEIGGSIAFISRTGGLVIKSQQTTDHFIVRKRYENLTRENEFGVINTIILGKDGMDDDIIYPSNIEENKIEWKILDNPFVDLYREEMIEKVAQYILGLNLTPFSLTGFVDGSYLDLNDTIEIIDKNNKTFEGVILNYENTSRIKSTVGADTQNTSPTNYNLAGSQKQEMRNVKLQVDHNNKTITGLVEEVENQNEKLAKFEVDIDKIQQEVSESATLTVEGETKNAELNIAKLYGGSPLSIKIHPIGEHIDLTYPTYTIYPSDNTYARVKSYLRIEQVEGDFSYDYDMPELLYMDENNYDEFEFNYGEKKCFKTKKIDFDENGNLIVLDTPVIENLPYLDLDLPEGDYKFTLLDGYTNAYIYGKFVTQNDYTNLFATKIELRSSITQTEDKIESEVGKVTDLVNGQVQDLNTKITETADSITESVNAQITNLDGEVQNVKGEVSLKLNTDDLFSQFNVNVDQVKITSKNFTLTEEGDITFNNGTAKNITIDGGNIELVDKGNTGVPSVLINDTLGEDMYEASFYSAGNLFRRKNAWYANYQDSSMTIRREDTSYPAVQIGLSEADYSTGEIKLRTSNSSRNPNIQLISSNNNTSCYITDSQITVPRVTITNFVESDTDAATVGYVNNMYSAINGIDISYSQGWTIARILNTNIAMCWTTSVFTTSVTTQSGNVYRSSEITMGLPSNLFTQLLVVNVTDRAANSLSWVCNRDQSDTTTLHYYIMCSVSSANQSRRNDFFVIGTTY